MPVSLKWSISLSETKSEIRARIDELEKFARSIAHHKSQEAKDILIHAGERVMALTSELHTAPEDLFQSVIRSHKTLCTIKKMDEDAAYGQDPSMYYTLAICGEAGEMGNKIVKALRNGNDPEAVTKAISSELPDILIYCFVLAYVRKMDPIQMVNEKVDIVIERAVNGYYGGPLPKP